MIAPLFDAWERRLASVDTNRVIRPFEWGLDWLELPESEDPLAAIQAFAQKAVAQSDQFFSPGPTDDYELDAGSYDEMFTAEAGVRPEYRELAQRLLEMTPPTGAVAFGLLKLYMKHVIPAMTWLTTGRRTVHTLYQYCWDTFEMCVPPSAILAALGEAQFQEARRHVELRIFSEYSARKLG